MDSEYDRYIVVSFVDVTLVLSIGDTVEEVPMKYAAMILKLPSGWIGWMIFLFKRLADF